MEATPLALEATRMAPSEHRPMAKVSTVMRVVRMCSVQGLCDVPRFQANRTQHAMMCEATRTAT